MVVGGALRSELGGEWGPAWESRSLGWGRGTAEVVLKGQHFLLRRRASSSRSCTGPRQGLLEYCAAQGGLWDRQRCVDNWGDVSWMVSGTEGGRGGDPEGLFQGTWGIRKVFEGRRHLRQESWTQGEGITEEFGM